MIGRLLRWYLDRHDPAWAPTGTRSVFTGYDEVKASAGAEAAKRQYATGRAILAPVKPAVRSNVEPFERKAAK